MADLKISALTASTTPLAGTEVLPIVQSSTTKQVSVANLTAGRAVSAASLALTTSPLPITSGGTGQTAWTANGVLYASGTTTLATSTALTYDGTNWLLGALGTGANYQVTTAGVYSSQAVSPTLMRSAAMVTNNNSGIIGWDFKAIDAVNKSALPSTGSVIGTMLSMNANTLDVSVPSGNLVIGTSGKGIDFSATPGTGTSELLADYEEGTWTPVISDGTNNATMGASNSGTYTRVGRMVTVTGYVQMSSKGSISGALRMTGLPFTVGTVYSGASVGFADGLSVTAGVTIGMYAAVSTTYTLLQKFSATTGSTDLLATDTTNSGQFIFSLTYFV